MEILRFVLFAATSMAFYEVVKSLVKDVMKVDIKLPAKKPKIKAEFGDKKDKVEAKLPETKAPEPEPEESKHKFSFIDRLKSSEDERMQEDIYVEEEDDLLEIDGVTERMLPQLKDAGFNSYTDIEMADLTDLKRTIQTSFPQVSDSELKLWRKQASFASQERWDDLDKLKAMIQKARQSKRIQ